MARRLLLLGSLLIPALAAAPLPDWYQRELPDAQFQARLVRDASEIQRLAGDRFDGEVIFVELKVLPLYGSSVNLERADFLIRARNNNDTSPAVTPDRIAGTAVLALGTEGRKSSGSVFADDPNAPIWPGAPGTGGRPRRLGGPPGVVGGGTSGEGRQTVEQREHSDDSVLDRLHAMELPLQAHEQPVSGYLYFEIPAKIKRKHLELSYDGPLGEFLVEFKRPE